MANLDFVRTEFIYLPMRTAPHHLQGGTRVFFYATFSTNLAIDTAARPCLLECMRLLAEHFRGDSHEHKADVGNDHPTYVPRAP
jgi:hypothetical protein